MRAQLDEGCDALGLERVDAVEVADRLAFLIDPVLGRGEFFRRRAGQSRWRRSGIFGGKI